MATIAELLVRIKSVGARETASSIRDVGTASERTEESTRELQRSTNELSSSFNKLRKSAAAYASYRIVKSIANTGLEFDRMNRALLAATGSTESAKEEMEFLRAEADRIGLSILSVGKSYAQLSAAAKGTKISQDQVRDVFTAVSEAAVVLGLSADDTKGSMRALVQVMSKGKVQAEELRGQIGERFPGAFQAAARSMHMSTEELSDMLEAGNLLADEFIPKFAAEIRRTYAMAVPEALESAQAAFGRFQTAVANAQNEVAQGGLLDALATMATYTSEWTSEAIKEVKGTAEWAAAFSVGQISFWEWMTTGSDEAQERLLEFKKAMDATLNDMSGKRIKIVRPEEEDTSPKKTRSEIKAEKRALDKARKEFERLKKNMLTEEQTIEESYKRRTSIILKNTQAGTDAQAKLLERSKQIYNEDRASFEANKTSELTSLVETLRTEEEVIKDSYEKRMELVKSSSFDNPEDRAELIKRIKADYNERLQDLKGYNSDSYDALVESLRTDEEALNDSYQKRKEIILANSEATELEKQDLLRRLDAEYAADVRGPQSNPETYDGQIEAINNFYQRRHDMIMENTQLTEEARTALEVELTQQRNEQLEALERARMRQIFEGSADTFSGLADLAKEFKGEQSKEYKAMFAAAQAFEIAQAIMKTYDAATGAYSAMSSIPYVGPALGAAAAAAAVGAGMANVAQIRSQSYSGAYDAGGNIPTGSFGLVGEVGPELVSGPATVIGRKDTAALMNQPQAPPPPPVNNIRIVNAFDTGVVGDYMGSDAGEKAILNVIKRNQNTVKSIVS